MGNFVGGLGQAAWEWSGCSDGGSSIGTANETLISSPTALLAMTIVAHQHRLEVSLALFGRRPVNIRLMGYGNCRIGERKGPSAGQCSWTISAQGRLDWVQATILRAET
jgi:hypothetical protein